MATSTTIVALPIKRKYLVLHDSRNGLVPYVVQTRKDLSELLGMRFHEDMHNENLKALLLFLGIALEYTDHVMIFNCPEPEGMFE